MNWLKSNTILSLLVVVLLVVVVIALAYKIGSVKLRGQVSADSPGCETTPHQLTMLEGNRYSLVERQKYLKDREQVSSEELASVEAQIVSLDQAIETLNNKAMTCQ